jgi:Zn-dependent hydrolases, including glyoxylases
MITAKSFVFNPFSENTYVIFNEKNDAFIIDPGNFSEQETETVRKFVSENNLKVKNILLTHAHIDHVLGLQEIYNQFKVPVLLHEIEKEILDRNPMDANRFGFFLQTFRG